MSSEDNKAEPARLTDEEMLARFSNSKKRPPCTETLGMRLTHVDQAKMTARFDFEARQDFANPTGAIQGGFIGAMLDEAMSTAAIIASNITMNAPTLEMKVSFLRPLFVGKASAEARILKWGRTTCFIEAELFDPEGQLVAKASATQAPKPFKRF
ncbi:MAG TPA: PaaI family thioesterase [Hyphomonadaceae bacterium]|nr:PaaI family thioesterase [Hyphomonadaceae bacterium]HPI46791.1 PaaI family thioesterase [Hyphomonadaceae bacterium]